MVLPELVEKCFGLSKVGAVKTFGKPTNNGSYQVPGFVRLAPSFPQSSEISRRTQFQKSSILFARYPYRRLEAVFRLTFCR